MKTKLKAALFCTFAALAGFSCGVLDTIQHSRQQVAETNAACETQPRLEKCVERAIAVQGIRYYFNGQEFRDGNFVTVLGAAE